MLTWQSCASCKIRARQAGCVMMHEEGVLAATVFTPLTIYAWEETCSYAIKLF